MANPVEEHRKSERKKELKKNKKNRLKQHNAKLLQSGNLSALKSEIRALENFKNSTNNGKLDPIKQRKLDKLQKDYKVLLAHVKQNPNAATKNATNNSASDTERTLKYPMLSVYYDAKFNPYGAAPPGKPMMFRYVNGSTTRNIQEAMRYAADVGWIVLSEEERKVLYGDFIEKDKDKDENKVEGSDSGSDTDEDQISYERKKQFELERQRREKERKRVEEAKFKKDRGPSESALRTARQLKVSVASVDIWGNEEEEEDGFLVGKDGEDVTKNEYVPVPRFKKRKKLESGGGDANLDPTAKHYTQYRKVQSSSGTQASSSSTPLPIPTSELVDEWYYKAMGSVNGPYSSQMMLDWSNAGYFPDDTPLRNSSMGDFLPFSRYKAEFLNVVRASSTTEEKRINVQDEMKEKDQQQQQQQQQHDLMEQGESGVRARIAALKQINAQEQHEIENQAPSTTREKENGHVDGPCMYPPSEYTDDNEGDDMIPSYLTAVDESDDGIIPYPSLEEQNNDDLAVHNYPTSDNPYILNDNEEMIDECAIGSYPIGDEGANYNTVMESYLSQHQQQPRLKKFEGDRAALGFVPTNLHRTKIQKTKTQKQQQKLYKKKLYEQPSEDKPEAEGRTKKSSVTDEYEQFMRDVNQLE